MKFYRCAHCGNIIAKLNDAGVPVVCCGEKMNELIANTSDGAKEKHVPVYSNQNGVVTVRVGEVDHPMLDAHYIQWIVLETKAGNQRKVLKPGDAPVATFYINPKDEVLAVYEYCNLHGLFKK